MQQRLKMFFLLLVDFLIVTITPYLALYVRLEGNIDSVFYERLHEVLPILICIRITTFYLFGLYKRLWRYASINEVVAIVSAVTVSSAVCAGYLFYQDITLPRSVYFINWLLMILLIGGSRFCVRLVHYWRKARQDHSGVSHVLIVGAGDAGAMIARELHQRYHGSKKLVGFVDDDQYKKDQKMFGVKVLGASGDIANIVNEQQINEIIVAMPSIQGEDLRKILNACKMTQCVVKTLPGMYELIDGKVSIQQLRNIDLEDLLRRDPVQLNLEEISCYLKGKIVLITGAGGSIGSELCRQIIKMSPREIILLGKGENSIYEIEGELRERYPSMKIKAVIADVRDKERVNAVFQQYKPQVIFHAAAHKHVPLMEEQPVEAVHNNIFGTKVLAEAADTVGVEIFVMISTDKAVNPTSVMGATKRVAELIVQSMSTKGKTKFVAVRFGNVLGSRGSVVPLFKKQIAQGGPITITHPEMKRYFMTIPEATQLVLQAGALAKGGEVFVLDMGEPVKIVDMANDLIQLSGLIPNQDIKIHFSGLRPGEKLFEELLTAEEGTTSTKHEKIFVANLKVVDEQKLYSGLEKLKKEIEPLRVIEAIMRLVPTYTCTRLKSPTSFNEETVQSVEVSGESNKVWQESSAISHGHL